VADAWHRAAEAAERTPPLIWGGSRNGGETISGAIVRACRNCRAAPELTKRHWMACPQVPQPLTHPVGEGPTGLRCWGVWGRFGPRPAPRAGDLHSFQPTGRPRVRISARAFAIASSVIQPTHHFGLNPVIVQLRRACQLLANAAIAASRVGSREQI
jgi:hypothetical protein